MTGRLNVARLCAALVLVLIVAARSQAGTITLAWEASTSPDVIGYYVVYGTAPGQYTQVVDAGNTTTVAIHGLADGQIYYFGVEAYSSNHVPSAPSNEVFGSTSNTPPQLTSPGPQSGAEGASITLPVSASDAEGDPLVFTSTGLPNGLFIDQFTGVISGTISFSASGTTQVTLTVSDGAVSTNVAFNWVVSGVDRAPTVGGVVNQSNPLGAVVSLPMSATDPDLDSLTFAAAGLPPGLAIDASTGVITGTLSSAGSYSVTITASDGVLIAARALSGRWWRSTPLRPWRRREIRRPAWSTTSHSSSWARIRTATR